jgi:2-polyprenyl-3-methyl-5-hydroxy-6-metoxy-1,4-benzoquinol methylase
MSENDEIYQDYLSFQMQHRSDGAARQRRKESLAYNYSSYLPSDLEGRILEIGPGRGELLEYLVIERQYKKVSAIDLSAEVVAHCNAMVPGTTEHVANSREFLGTRGNSYEVVLMLQVLEHVPKAEVVALLRALYGALKPRGRLIVEVPNMVNPITGMEFRYADFTHETGYTPASLEFIIRKAGFPEVRVFPARTPFSFSIRYAHALVRGFLDRFFALIRGIYFPLFHQTAAPIIYAVATKNSHQ